MDTHRLRPVDLAMVAIVTILTLSTAYIHYWVGGTLLLLNAVGYATLVVVLIATTLFFRRALPLVLSAIAGYAAVTILGWLIMGPYFDVAYLAKGIEIVLIATISVWLVVNRSWTRDSYAWGLTLPATAIRVVTRRKPAAAAANAGDE
jgi:hypothetical protein